MAVLPGWSKGPASGIVLVPLEFRWFLVSPAVLPDVDHMPRSLIRGHSCVAPPSLVNGPSPLELSHDAICPSVHIGLQRAGRRWEPGPPDGSLETELDARMTLAEQVHEGGRPLCPRPALISEPGWTCR